MSTERVTDEAVKALDLRFKSGNTVTVDRANITREEWLAIRAALSAADAVRDGSASGVVDALAVIDETIQFLERIAPTPLGGVNETPEHFYGRVHDLKIAYAALAALRQHKDTSHD